ncbi:MAG TPA: SDR family oxidoreductase [Spirochaetia bacterium]|nr:SDR family oxidoreductase [Spirochaetia bacterium]
MTGKRPFSDRVVVITGSSRGIGRETAIAFGRAGARVVINGRDAERLEKTAAQLRAEGIEVEAVAADIARGSDAARLISAAKARFGHIDVLVNNAGVSMRGLFSELVPEVVETVVRTNITGAVVPTVAAMNELRERRGSIIFVSSLAGVHGFPNVSIYSAAKMALTGLAQSLDAELAGSGVHVGLIFLGFTENDPDKSILAADGREIIVKRRHQMSQSQAAQEIVKLTVRRRRQRVLTPPGRLLYLAAHVAPVLVRAVLRRSGGRIHAGTSAREANR